VQNLAMQLHCTVPAGTQHGSREPQCCWQCTCIAPCQQAHSPAGESHSAVHALKACKTWQCTCIALCQQARSTAPGSHNAVHALQARPGNANALHRASRHASRLERAIVLCMHTQHAELGNATALHRASQQARSTAPGSHCAVHALQACMHPSMQDLVMQMYCTVPAGTQHGSREPS